MFNDIPRTFVGTITFRVEGITCDHCAQAVTAAIRTVHGVDAITVDRATGTVTVTAAQPLDRTDIAAALDDAGHPIIA